jgi:hypothetical protein
MGQAETGLFLQISVQYLKTMQTLAHRGLEVGKLLHVFGRKPQFSCAWNKTWGKIWHKK